MEITKVEIYPSKESLNPEIKIDIELTFPRLNEIPLEITGKIFSDNDKKIANIYSQEFNRDDIELGATNYSTRQNETITLSVIAEFTPKVLDYITNRRESNKRGDVILNLFFLVRYLESKTVLSHMKLGEDYISQQSHEYYKGAKLVVYQYQRNFQQDNSNMYILSGDNGTTFMRFRQRTIKKEYTIKSSDWLHDYCPVFNIGNFYVLEYEIPEFEEGTGDLNEKINESLNAITKMQENIRKGEWYETIENSRVIWELLRYNDDIKDLFQRNGYTEQAYEDLNKALVNLFNYSSKFHHKLDKEKKIMPDNKASKEDAYLIYSLSMQFLNLVLQKSSRVS